MTVRKGEYVVLAVLLLVSMIQIEFPHYYSIVEGQVSINVGLSVTVEIDCNQGDIVRGWFSAEYSKVELIVIHFEDYNSSGISDESKFLYHVYQKSYSMQFTSGRSGTWNFIFMSNISTQLVTFSFEIWSEDDWNSMSVLQIACILTGITIALFGVYKLMPRIRKKRDLGNDITTQGVSS